MTVLMLLRNDEINQMYSSKHLTDYWIHSDMFLRQGSHHLEYTVNFTGFGVDLWSILMSNGL